MASSAAPAAAEDREAMMARASNAAEAENLQGNTAFTAGQFSVALDFYSAAIKLAPKTAKYYSNRSAAHAKLNDLENAVIDGNMAVTLDPGCAKYHNRVVTALKMLQRWEALHLYEFVIKERGFAQIPLGSDCQPSKITDDVKVGKSAVKASATVDVSNKSAMPKMPVVTRVDPAAWFLFGVAPNDDFYWWEPFGIHGKDGACLETEAELYLLRFLVDSFMLPYMDGKNENELSVSRFFAYAMVALRVGLIPAVDDFYLALEYLSMHLVVRGRKEAEMRQFWKESPYESPHLMKTMQQLRTLIQSVPMLATEETVFAMPATNPDFDRLSCCVDTSFEKFLASPAEPAVRLMLAFDRRYRTFTTGGTVFSLRDLVDIVAVFLRQFVFTGRDGMLEILSLLPYIKFRTISHAWYWVTAALSIELVDPRLDRCVARWFILLHQHDLHKDPSFLEAMYEVVLDHFPCVLSEEYITNCARYDQGFGAFVAKFKAKMGTGPALEMVKTVLKLRHVFGIPKAICERGIEALTAK